MVTNTFSKPDQFTLENILILSNCVHILCYCFHILGDGRKVTIDVESKTGPEILGIFGKVAGATDL